MSEKPEVKLMFTIALSLVVEFNVVSDDQQLTIAPMEK